MPVSTSASGSEWPSLRVDDWTETRDTLHMWAQIVGKIRLTHAPLVNHWWQCTLYVSSRGLTTTAIPYGAGSFEVEFDFIDHHLVGDDSLMVSNPLHDLLRCGCFVQGQLRCAGFQPLKIEIFFVQRGLVQKNHA